jgi:ParB/RepB/Spo0J family partition protein
MLKISDISISDFNFRENCEDVSDLENSIKERGLFSRIILRKNKEKIEVLAGSRRFTALKNIKGLEGQLEDSEYFLMDDLSDKRAALISIEENQRRRDFSPFELNKAILTLNQLGYKEKEIALYLGVTPHRLKRLEKLSADRNKMPDIVKEELNKRPEESKFNDLQWSYISNKLDDKETIKEVADYIIEKEVPAKEVPSIIKMVENNHKAADGGNITDKKSGTAKDPDVPTDGPIEYSHKGELILDERGSKMVFKVLGKGEDEVVPVDQYLEYLRHPTKFKCYITFKMKIKPVE